MKIKASFVNEVNKGGAKFNYRPLNASFEIPLEEKRTMQTKGHYLNKMQIDQTNSQDSILNRIKKYRR